MEVQRQELQGMPRVGAVQCSPGPPLLQLQSTQNALSTCRKMALSQKSKRERSWSKMKIWDLGRCQESPWPALARAWVLFAGGETELWAETVMEVSANASDVAAGCNSSCSRCRECRQQCMQAAAAVYAGLRQVGVTELSSTVCSPSSSCNSCLLHCAHCADRFRYVWVENELSLCAETFINIIISKKLTLCANFQTVLRHLIFGLRDWS
jgi:hypothetical protein